MNVRKKFSYIKQTLFYLIIDLLMMVRKGILLWTEVTDGRVEVFKAHLFRRGEADEIGSIKKGTKRVSSIYSRKMTHFRKFQTGVYPKAETDKM